MTFDNDFIDDPQTKNHKTRLVKITIYAEVDTNEGSDSETEDRIDWILKDSIRSRSGLTINDTECNLGPIRSDDLDDYKQPVGYLTPDGKWYLLESHENELAHLELADLIYNLYKNTGYFNRFPSRHHNDFMHSIDYYLERTGFIKVHKSDIRYPAGVPMYEFKDKDVIEIGRTPSITKEQYEELCKYVKKYGMICDGKRFIFINDKEIDATKFKEFDELAINKLFMK